METFRAPLESAPAPSARIGRWRAFASWIRACYAHSRQRRQLSLLSDEQLHDIGLSRGEVARECGRWPWDGAHRAKLRLIARPPFLIAIRWVP